MHKNQYTLEELAKSVGMPQDALKMYGVALNQGNDPNETDSVPLYGEEDRTWLAKQWAKDQERYFRRKSLFEELSPHFPSEKYARMSTKEYCDTERWASLTLDCKRRDGYRCRLCGRQGYMQDHVIDGKEVRLPTGGLQSHHSRYTNKGLNYQAELADLTCLCAEHHEWFEFLVKGTRRK